MRRLAVGLLATLALAAPAAARARVSYDGFTHGRQLSVDATDDLAKITLFAFSPYRYRCADGRRSEPRRYDLARTGSIAVTRTGTFAAQGTFSATLRLGRRSVAGRVTLQFGGTLTRDAVRGTFSGVFDAAGRRLTCRTGGLPFASYRWGTPRAPFRDATTATGLYRGSGPHALRVAGRPLVPARVLRGFSFADRAPCRSGGVLTNPGVTVGSLAIAAGRFAATGQVKASLSGGGSVTYRYRVSGRFARHGGAYGWSGRVDATAVLRRGGRAIDSCPVHAGFSGGLVRATTAALR